MATSQEEIRRLMKAAKQKTSAATGPRRKTGSKAEAAASRASDKQVKPGAKPAPSASAIPVGFFDDTLADAKARKVDVAQLAEKQLESDWEAFQEFADEVEQQAAKDEQSKQEEIKEREAEEKLENMAYMDRYRLALERAANLRKPSKADRENNVDRGKKRKLEPEADAEGKGKGDGEGDGEGEGEGESDAASAIESTVLELRKKQRKARKVEKATSDDSDDFDPCNWRSRGI